MKERTALYNLSNPFKPKTDEEMTEIVVCSHCEDRYPRHEFKMEPNPDGKDWIVCKNYPECDATLLHIFTVR